LGSTNNHCIPLGYVLQLLVHGHNGTLLFSGSLQFLPGIMKDYQETGDQVFTAEEVNEVGAKGSENATMVNVETLLEAFLEDFQTWKSLLNC